MPTQRGQHCAPGRGGASCFTVPEMRRIATQWNAHHPRHRHIATHHRRKGGALWHDINTRMQAECATEHCWATKLAAPLAETSFRPGAPTSWRTNPTEWLSTTDIHTVLAQYEPAYPGFHFVGAVPVDFASPDDSGTMGRCVTQELCQVDVREWNHRGVDKVGIVFNMDAHDESGSHWTSMYVDTRANAVLYYDSFGDRPPPEVAYLMDALAEQLTTEHGTPTTVRANEHRHQFHNTECGVYSISFIAQMLEHRREGFASAADAYTTYVNDGLNDAQMNRYRRVFFRTLHGDGGSGSGGQAGGGRRTRGRATRGGARGGKRSSHRRWRR